MRSSFREYAVLSLPFNSYRARANAYTYGSRESFGRLCTCGSQRATDDRDDALCRAPYIRVHASFALVSRAAANNAPRKTEKTLGVGLTDSAASEGVTDGRYDPHISIRHCSSRYMLRSPLK